MTFKGRSMLDLNVQSMLKKQSWNQNADGSSHGNTSKIWVAIASSVFAFQSSSKRESRRSKSSRRRSEEVASALLCTLSTACGTLYQQINLGEFAKRRLQGAVAANTARSGGSPREFMIVHTTFMLQYFELQVELSGDALLTV